MVEGGKKDSSFIAKEMGDAMAILGHKYFFLAIIDGVSNMQSAGRILMALNKQLTVVLCALHLVHLIFGQIALISEVAALIESYRAIRNWIYCHHFIHDLFKSLVMKANKGKFVGLPEAADSRMYPLQSTALRGMTEDITTASTLTRGVRFTVAPLSVAIHFH